MLAAAGLNAQRRPRVTHLSDLSVEPRFALAREHPLSGSVSLFPKIAEAWDPVRYPDKIMHVIPQRGILHRVEQREHRNIFDQDFLKFIVDLLSRGLLISVPALLERLVDLLILVAGRIREALAVEENVKAVRPDAESSGSALRCPTICTSLSDRYMSAHDFPATIRAHPGLALASDLAQRGDNEFGIGHAEIPAEGRDSQVLQSARLIDGATLDAKFPDSGMAVVVLALANAVSHRQRIIPEQIIDLRDVVGGQRPLIRIEGVGQFLNHVGKIDLKHRSGRHQPEDFPFRRQTLERGRPAAATRAVRRSNATPTERKFRAFGVQRKWR